MSTMADNITLLAAASVIITAKSVESNYVRVVEADYGANCLQWLTRRRREKGMEHLVLNELALTGTGGFHSFFYVFHHQRMMVYF